MPQRLYGIRQHLQLGSAHCQVLACTLPEARARTVFAGIAAAKVSLAAALDAVVTLPDTAASAADASSFDHLHRMYAAWLPCARRSGEDTETARNVAVLDRAEDRLLQQFESALRGSQARALRDALKRYLPQIQSCHAELRRLQTMPSAAFAASRPDIAGHSEATGSRQNLSIRRFE